MTKTYKNLEKRVSEIINSSPDPLNVRKSTAKIFNELDYIEIDYEKLKTAAKKVKEKIDKKQLLDEEQFGSKDPSPQLIFILDTVNFCFWAEKNKEKWTVEFPKGNFISNGWYGLVAAIQRAQAESIPILDASYLKSLKIDMVKHIFRSANEIEIPLLQKRVEYLNDAGKVLSEKYDGDIYNLLAKTGLDVSKIASEVAKNFSSYSDFNNINGEKIYFYKRAQIFAYDVSLLKPIKAENLDSLTAFADYKIPQILRSFEIINYNPELAEKVDSYVPLKVDSREETEIRSATIWACEILAKEAGVKPVLIDNALWKMSQGLKDVKPYHRVLTTNY